MERFVLAGLLTLFTSSAMATIIQIDLESEVAPEAGWIWNRPDPLPTNIATTFWIDTLSADTSLFALHAGPGDTCLDSFDAHGLNGSNLRVHADSYLLWSSDALELQFYGRNPSGRCPGGFFGGLTGVEGERNFGTFTDFWPGIGASELLNGGDPIANILLAIEGTPSPIMLEGEWGRFYAGLTSVRISEVPEPSALALFAIGLLGIAIGETPFRALRSRAASTTH